MGGVEKEKDIRTPVIVLLLLLRKGVQSEESIVRIVHAVNSTNLLARLVVQLLRGTEIFFQVLGVLCCVVLCWRSLLRQFSGKD